MQAADGPGECAARVSRADHRPPARIRELRRHNQAARRGVRRPLGRLPVSHERKLADAGGLERSGPRYFGLAVAFEDRSELLGQFTHAHICW